MLSYGCPFSDAAGMVRFFRGNMARRKDAIFCSEGPEGAGKSTTTGQIVRRLDPSYDLEADSIFTLGHLLDVLEDARKGQIHNVDEAINIFHNQDWATWQAKALSKIIRQMRIMRSTWALNVPDFEGLHPYLRDYRIRFRLYHRPVFDADGMGNGPAQPLWKMERFDYKERRVVTWWHDLGFDLKVDSLDSDPKHQAYERKKEENFIRMVRELKHRLGEEEPMVKQKRPGRGKRKAKATPPTTT